MYLRRFFRYLLTVYWLLFAYLASRIIMDWNSILGPFDNTTQLFILFMVFPGFAILPYIIKYCRFLHPYMRRRPRIEMWIQRRMDYLEDIHSLWYEVLLVLKYIGFFIFGMWVVSVALSTLVILGWGLALIILSR